MVADIAVTPGSLSWLRLARRAKFLAALTLIWLGIEGTVGVIAGILAGSIALTLPSLQLIDAASLSFECSRNSRPKPVIGAAVLARHSRRHSTA
jgi:hypothetical protein